MSVRDNGKGIDPAMLPAVFELFRRVDMPARSDSGLGVGLALSRSLVEMHGGRIDARSDGPDRGSEFIVRLPLQSGPIEAPVHERRRPEGSALRVLVVDDSVDSAESMAMVLEMSGHEVRQAHSGEQALGAVREFRPDAVLMDIGMPDLSGYEVAERLRSAPDTREVALIAMTGYGQKADRERSAAAGFDHHLVKPLDFDKLNEVLASFARVPATDRAS
jgi:CheY-like chemotaxis protein